MPTIARKDGFRIDLYPDDHEPVHVHVKKAGSDVKVNALTLELMAVRGDISSKDIRQAIALVSEYQSGIKRKWKELHGNR